MHILYIEENDHFREVVSHSLIRAGYSLVSAKSVDELPIVLSKEGKTIGSFDVIITDDHLGDGKTGTDLAKNLRSRNYKGKIILYAGHAYAESSLRSKDFDEGFDKKNPFRALLTYLESLDLRQ